MKSNVLKNLAVVAVVILAGIVSANAQSVSGAITGGSVTRGKAARGTVVLSIPGGLHVNSSRPGSEYAIATRVTVSSRGSKVSAVTYPRGKNRKFSFSEDTINVYEGRTSFGFNITVPPTFKGDSVTVNVSVRYQACTDEVCYPPKTKTATIRARVK